MMNYFDHALYQLEQCSVGSNHYQKVMLSIEEYIAVGNKPGKTVVSKVWAYVFPHPTQLGYSFAFYIRNAVGGVISANLLEVSKRGKQIDYYMIATDSQNYYSFEKGAVKSIIPSLSNELEPFYITNQANWELSAKGGSIEFSLSPARVVQMATIKRVSIKVGKISQTYWRELQQSMKRTPEIQTQ